MLYQVDDALLHAMSGIELSRVRTELRLFLPEAHQQKSDRVERGRHGYAIKWIFHSNFILKHDPHSELDLSRSPKGINAGAHTDAIYVVAGAGCAINLAGRTSQDSIQSVAG